MGKKAARCDAAVVCPQRDYGRFIFIRPILCRAGDALFLRQRCRQLCNGFPGEPGGIRTHELLIRRIYTLSRQGTGKSRCSRFQNHDLSRFPVEMTLNLPHVCRRSAIIAGKTAHSGRVMRKRNGLATGKDDGVSCKRESMSCMRSYMKYFLRLLRVESYTKKLNIAESMEARYAAFLQAASGVIPCGTERQHV